MAVYTEISDSQLAEFLQDYEIGTAVSCKGIAEGVENSNFLLFTERGPYILTLYEKRVALGDLPFFLGLMEHLAAKNVPCPTPIHGLDGNVLRSLCGKPAAITSFLSGVSPTSPNLSHCKNVGLGLADLHINGSNYSARRKNSLSRDGWEKLFLLVEDKADHITPGLTKLIRSEIDYLKEFWPDDLPKGVIHADLFPDNVFFKDNQLTGLIDFYFACNDFFAYDLAICLNAWCFESDFSFNRHKAKSMTLAYNNRRPLTPSELSALPMLARGAALRFLTTRLFDWLNVVEGALVKPKDPIEYVHKLRFHQSIKNASIYGI
ncbi:MAG: homoserine kinase [Gammaproteobacteria bacterium]|nr:homoserine kinase [Gammaproteobacteria bacterium]